MNNEYTKISIMFNYLGYDNDNYIEALTFHHILVRMFIIINQVGMNTT